MYTKWSLLIGSPIDEIHRLESIIENIWQAKCQTARIYQTDKNNFSYIHAPGRFLNYIKSSTSGLPVHFRTIAHFEDPPLWSSFIIPSQSSNVMNKQSTKIISNYLVGVIMSLIRNTDQVLNWLMKHGPWLTMGNELWLMSPLIRNLDISFSMKLLESTSWLCCLVRFYHMSMESIWSNWNIRCEKNNATMHFS